jgi:hypothetical protein
MRAFSDPKGGMALARKRSMRTSIVLVVVCGTLAGCNASTTPAESAPTENDPTLDQPPSTAPGTIEENVQPLALALDAANVYIVDGTGQVDYPSKPGRIIARTRAGSAAAHMLVSKTLVTADAGWVLDPWIATDGTHVFYMEDNESGGPGVQGTSRLFSIPVDGGAPTLLATPRGFNAAAMDEAFIYVADRPPGTSPLPTIMRYAKADGAATTLAHDLKATGASAIAVNDTYVVYGFEDGNVYGPPASTIERAPKTGGVATTIVTGVDVVGIAVDATTVFWLGGAAGNDGCGGSGSLMSVPISGGTPLGLAGGLPGPSAFALTADSVYFGDVKSACAGSMDPTRGVLRKVSKAGGATTAIAPVVVQSIAVDDSGIYYGEDDGAAGSVAWLAR